MDESRKTGIQDENKSAGWVVFLLRLTNILFFVAALILVGRIIYLQYFYRPNPQFADRISPKSQRETIEAKRGDILAYDGRVLATTVPVYQIHMDCTVRTREFAKQKKKAKNSDSDSTQGQVYEAAWRRKAMALSRGLAEIYGDKSAAQYYSDIIKGRESGNGFMKIGGIIDHETLLKLNQLPLFNENSRLGGKIVDTLRRRQYPYNSLARRTIGRVDEENNLRIGIEGKFDYALRGTNGYRFLKRTDGRGHMRIADLDSTRVLPVDGMDVRTTLDIDIQDIVDRALREKILGNQLIDGGCAIVMEVETGAIRAMVNLMRNDAGAPREIFNYAIGQAFDPGSVFKAASLMTLLEDHKITLDTKVPTNNGRWTYNKKEFIDEYIQKPRWKESTISVIDAFKISSNNIFRQLVCKYYTGDEQRFVSKLHEYKLSEAFDFDIIGLASPNVISPKSKDWSGTTLPSIAIGYSVLETPLHILTFYNAIAGKGKMMKPYLVECFEKNGEKKQEFGPVILSGSICSRATAETITQALMAVTSEGTGKDLKDCKCKVAGKTGTAQIPFRVKVKGEEVSVYKDDSKNRKHQATFVGFFPAENPKYTAIVVFYSKFGKQDLYGSTGAPVFKKIVDGMYVLNMIEQ